LFSLPLPDYSPAAEENELEHQIADIQDRGFAVIPSVFSSTEISAVSDALVESSLSHSRAGIRHAMRDPAIARFANSRCLLDFASEVLGGVAIPFRATLFAKSSAANWLVIWHQDTALPLRKQRQTPTWGPWSVKDAVFYAHAPAKALKQIIALRLHLDDSLPENGPLRILPGSHRRGVLDDKAIRELASASAPVDCPVERGGILAMRPLVVHSSSKSRSEAPRRVLHIEYARTLAIDENLDLAVT
jgi:hypothetical protein